jgi:hypothetical protein
MRGCQPPAKRGGLTVTLTFDEIITNKHDNRNNHQKNQKHDCPR